MRLIFELVLRPGAYNETKITYDNGNQQGVKTDGPLTPKEWNVVNEVVKNLCELTEE